MDCYIHCVVPTSHTLCPHGDPCFLLPEGLECFCECSAAGDECLQLSTSENISISPLFLKASLTGWQFVVPTLPHFPLANMLSAEKSAVVFTFAFQSVMWFFSSRLILRCYLRTSFKILGYVGPWCNLLQVFCAWSL